MMYHHCFAFRVVSTCIHTYPSPTGNAPAGDARVVPAFPSVTHGEGVASDVSGKVQGGCGVWREG